MQTLVPTGDRNPNGHAEETIRSALVGRYGSRRWSFRYDLHDSDGVYIQALDDVRECSITQNWLADIKRTARFLVRDTGIIDFLSDMIKPYVRLHLPPYGDDDWVEWPMGMFMLDSPVRVTDAPGVAYRRVQAYDQLQRYRDDRVDDRYSVTATTTTTEDFADTTYNVTFTGTWTRVSGTAYSGTHAWKAPAVAHSASASTALTVPVDATQVRVRVKVSSEEDFDYLEVWRGAAGTGTLIWDGSGEIDWTLVTIPIDGDTQVTFRYIKDSSATEGSDTAWIDDVAIDIAGSLVTDQIVALLGDVEKVVSVSTKLMPSDLEWEPGTTKLEIINDLLDLINYESLSFDEDGRAVVTPYASPADRTSEWTYADDDESLIMPTVEQELDVAGVPNKWVLVVSEPDRDPIVGTYTNNDPSSPTSTVNRDRTIVDFRTEQNAADQDALDEKAYRLAFEASQIFEAVTFETGLNPLHSGNDVYRIRFAPLAVDAKYAEQSWEVELVAGAVMRHRARRVVTV